MNIWLTIFITVCFISIGFLAFQFFDNIFQISPLWKPKWCFIGSAVILAIVSFFLIIYGVSVSLRILHFFIRYSLFPRFWRVLSFASQ